MEHEIRTNNRTYRAMMVKIGYSLEDIRGVYLEEIIKRD